MPKVYDGDRQEVNAGDWIVFSYGIPPIKVVAEVVQRGKSLIVLTPDHKPHECNLRTLKRYVGDFYIEEKGTPDAED